MSAQNKNENLMKNRNQSQQEQTEIINELKIKLWEQLYTIEKDIKNFLQ